VERERERDWLLCQSTPCGEI